MEETGLALILALIVMGIFLFFAFLGAVTASGMQGLSNKIKKAQANPDEDHSDTDKAREEDRLKPGDQ